jgi:hypothetical protein
LAAGNHFSILTSWRTVFPRDANADVSEWRDAAH